MIKVAKQLDYRPILLSTGVLLGMTFLLHLSLTATAEAGHGCPSGDYYHVHWERSSNPRTNTYKHSVSLWEDQGIDYATVVDGAAGNWNDSQGYIDLSKMTGFGTPDTYVFIKDDPNDPAWGSTNESPDKCTATTSHFSFADVTLNSDAIEFSIQSGTSTLLRRKVSSHEFGHTMGLSHPSVSLSTPAVMHQGWNGYYWARTRDINVMGWEQLYGHLD